MRAHISAIIRRENSKQSFQDDFRPVFKVIFHATKSLKPVKPQEQHMKIEPCNWSHVKLQYVDNIISSSTSFINTIYRTFGIIIMNNIDFREVKTVILQYLWFSHHLRTFWLFIVMMGVMLVILPVTEVNYSV
jgi:hypothetical protein